MGFVKLVIGYQMANETSRMRKSGFRDRKWICKSLLLLNAVFLVFNGIFWIFMLPTIFNMILEKMLTIEEGTPAYEAWKKPAIPTLLK